jgi:Homing endonuclease associated repeat
MSKAEIMAAIRKCAKELGHCPNLGELTARERVSRREVQRLFGNYGMAVRACGMEPAKGSPTKVKDLFADWARVTRKLGKLPTIFDYERESVYSAKPLISRFKGWRQVPGAMLAYAEREKLDNEWADVAALIRESQTKSYGMELARTGELRGTGRLLRDRPTYGPPMMDSGLAYGPANELGVVFLFGMVARQLGFVVMRIQTGFPDCEAMRKIDDQTWQKVRIEFEYESRNFLRHGHPPSGCDLIVCWIHNWHECPVEVVELSGVG